jgi:hypothetical protein
MDKRISKAVTVKVEIQHNDFFVQQQSSFGTGAFFMFLFEMLFSDPFIALSGMSFSEYLFFGLFGLGC